MTNDTDTISPIPVADFGQVIAYMPSTICNPDHRQGIAVVFRSELESFDHKRDYAYSTHRATFIAGKWLFESGHYNLSLAAACTDMTIRSGHVAA